MLCDETGWYVTPRSVTKVFGADEFVHLFQCDLLESTFHLEFDQSLAVSQHIKWITAYEKTAPGMGGTVMDEKRGYKAQKPLVSFVPPSAGMFVWLAVHLDSHKDFNKLRSQGEDPTRVLLEKLFIELAENKVGLASGTSVGSAIRLS